MQKAIFAHFKSSILFLAWVIPVVYCFIVFLPIPGGIATGLDPSWQYAISRAAADKFIFGKDIIFTHGPLGYLTTGAALEQNFFLIAGFRFIVYSALFIITFAKIVKLKTNLQKISLALSLLFPFLLWIPTDYQILFIFIIILSSSDNLIKKSIRWWSLGLGAFAGFCLLTKFTLGIYTLGSLSFLLLANFYSSINSKSDKTSSFFALINSFLAAISISFILLAPEQYLLNFKKALICLTFSATTGVVVWFTQQRLNNKTLLKFKEVNSKKVLNPKSPIQIVSWCCFYVVYCFCLFTTILHSSPSLIDYLRSSLEISSGYSSAMSLVGSPQLLSLAVFGFVLISILLFLIAREGNLAFSLALFFVLTLAFKHGFVRHGGAAPTFAWCTPILVSLCITKIRGVRLQKLSYLLHFHVLLLALVFRMTYGGGIPEAFAPSKVVSNLSAVFNLSGLQSYLESSSATNLAGVKLPENVTSLVKDKKIDIIPWEISLVEANKLNWKPRPIFQSYSAYTSYLDNINFKSISTEPRDYILYNFSSIDSRHPFFDEPKTFFNVLCNYKPSAEVPNFVNTPSLSNLIILEKRQASMCPQGTVGKRFSMHWNNSQDIEVNDGVIVRAAINIEYSIFGKIYKTLFRSPPVMVNVNYTNGSTSSYRIIPENSDNGVIISHLPQNDSQALSLFQGDLSNSVRSFSFFTSNSLLYSPNIDVAFTSSKFLASAASKRPDISQLTSVRFLPAQTDEYLDSIDSIDSKQESKEKHFERGNVIYASGWATRKLNQEKSYWVLLTYDSNNQPLAVAETGEPRPDVAKYFNNSNYTNSGWSINFNSELMPEGVHDIKSWIYNPTNNSATPLNGMYRVEIR